MSSVPGTPWRHPNSWLTIVGFRIGPRGSTAWIRLTRALSGNRCILLTHMKSKYLLTSCVEVLLLTFGRRLFGLLTQVLFLSRVLIGVTQRAWYFTPIHAWYNTTIHALYITPPPRRMLKSVSLFERLLSPYCLHEHSLCNTWFVIPVRYNTTRNPAGFTFLRVTNLLM